MENENQDQQLRPLVVALCLLVIGLVVLLGWHIHPKPAGADQVTKDFSGMAKAETPNVEPVKVAMVEIAKPPSAPGQMSETDKALAQFGLSSESVIGIHLKAIVVPPIRVPVRQSTTN